MTRLAGCVVSSALIIAAATSLPAQTLTAQPVLKNEVGLVIGATLTPAVGLQRGGSVQFNSSVALGAEYDRRAIGRRFTLDVGVDFLASPFDVKARNAAADVSPQYAYLFLTPHVRLHFNADGKLQPWVLLGGGYADFAPAQPAASSVKVTGAGSTGALEFGGGVDTRALITLKGIPLVGSLPIGTRFEVRDFYSGQPRYGLPTTSSLQNNVAFTGGLLLRF